MRLFFLVTSSIFALSLFACHSAPAEDTNALEFRTYDVPKGTVRPLVTTLKDALWMGENKNVGRATVTPDGRLAVYATHQVQIGVQGLVEEITKHPPPADQSIELHYFAIVGKPAAAPEPPPAGAKEIQAALDEITRTQGPQAFTVAARIRLSSLHDEWATVGDVEHFLVKQLAVQTADGVYSTVEIHANTQKLETHVRLLPDKVVVLGASGQHTADVPEGATLYYVVRLAPRADGPNP